MVDKVILLEEYRKRINDQEKIIAEQSFKINDLKDVIDRLNEDIENLNRVIKQMKYIDPVDSMLFTDDDKD
jgi:uncharacterized coiled-coil DUF342 family protein